MIQNVRHILQEWYFLAKLFYYSIKKDILFIQVSNTPELELKQLDKGTLCKSYFNKNQFQYFKHLNTKIKMLLRYGTSQKILRFDNLKWFKNSIHFSRMIYPCSTILLFCIKRYLLHAGKKQFQYLFCFKIFSMRL